jgi:ribosome-binding protein aMBF1 (putative translation factor)
VARTRDALKILDQVIGHDPQLRRTIAEERINADVARMIYDERSKAGLTQRELAELVGTKQSVIARLEDADYQGHSLSMLNRIAAALNRALIVRMAPAPTKRRQGRQAKRVAS